MPKESSSNPKLFWGSSVENIERLRIARKALQGWIYAASAWPGCLFDSGNSIEKSYQVLPSQIINYAHDAESRGEDGVVHLD
jgi:hypothetical protein